MNCVNILFVFIDMQLICNIMIDQYFDKTYLINLDRRPDRLRRVAQRCAEAKISFQRISAVDGANCFCELTAAGSGIDPRYWNTGALGLVLTFRNIIAECIKSKYESVLILEDDVFFHDDFVFLVNQGMPLIPQDWETIYFGALHVEPFQLVNDRIGRIKKAYHTHCWALNQNIFRECMESTARLNGPLDVIIANEIHARGRSYCFSLNLAHQEADYSDILNDFAMEKL